MVDGFDVSGLTVSELRALERSIRLELERGAGLRTTGPLVAALAETLALRVYGGSLMPPSTAAYDLIDPQGRRIQVKARELPRGDQRFFQFKSLDFDMALCLRFQRETGSLEWAREFDVSELRELVRTHASGPRLPAGHARHHGFDVTAPFRDALAVLGRESSRS